MKADCRKCVYFIPLEQMPIDLVEKANAWLEKHRPDAELLGWCNYFNRPVTYYEGTCHGFVKKEMKQLTLLDYLRR